MKRLWILVLMLVVFSGSTAWAQQPQSTIKPNLTVARPLVLYDDFNGPRIDPSKWVGTWGDTSDLREAVRELAPTFQGEGNNRRLQMLLYSYADNGTNVDGHGGRFGLQSSRPDLITETSFTVVVNRTSVVGCETNPGLAIAQAEFRGRFFSTESPTSQLGDVEVVINVNRQPWMSGSALQVFAFYERCEDEYCGARTQLGTSELGYADPGQPAKLRVKWDQPNHQFIFQLNREPEVLSQYGVSDSFPPWDGRKSISILYAVPNCTTPPRPRAMMDAYFDNVYVNAH